MARKIPDEVKNASIDCDELNHLTSTPDGKIDYNDIVPSNNEKIANLKRHKTHQNPMIEAVIKLPKSTCFDDIDAVKLQRQWRDEWEREF